MTRQGPSEKRRAVGTAARLPSAIAAQARTVAGPSQISNSATLVAAAAPQHQ